VLVIAHRGASFEQPENTLPAFARAIELGADYVELDVHADADGRLVVTHDSPRAGRAYLTLEEALDLMRGIELKSPRRYRRHNVVERTVRQLGPDDVLVCFERGALALARALRPGLRTVQHVGFGVSIRAASDAWAAGFADARASPRAHRSAGRRAQRAAKVLTRFSHAPVEAGGHLHRQHQGLLRIAVLSLLRPPLAREWRPA